MVRIRNLNFQAEENRHTIRPVHNSWPKECGMKTSIFVVLAVASLTAGACGSGPGRDKLQRARHSCRYYDFQQTASGVGKSEPRRQVSADRYRLGVGGKQSRSIEGTRRPARHREVLCRYREEPDSGTPRQERGQRIEICGETRRFRIPPLVGLPALAEKLLPADIPVRNPAFCARKFGDTLKHPSDYRLPPVGFSDAPAPGHMQ